jgi:hypothetical protein
MKKLIFILTFLMMISVVHAVVTSVDNDLLYVWKFDDGTGSIATEEISGFNIYNVNAWSTNAQDGNYSVDCSSTNADTSSKVDSTITGNNPRTISVWIYPDAMVGANDNCVYSYGAFGPYAIESLNWNVGGGIDNTRKLFQWHYFTDVGIEGPRDKISDRWYHVVYTGDGNEGILYLNGVQNATALVGAQSTPPSSFYICNGYGGSLYFEGEIDELYIWNRSLDSDEVLQLYNGTHPFYPFAPNIEIDFDYEPLTNFSANATP